MKPKVDRLIHRGFSFFDEGISRIGCPGVREICRAWFLAFFCACLCSMASQAQAQESLQAESPPLWEFGAGFGYAHYEHYPASNQFSDIALPFPTFQYRGEILRADDREGTRAYLLKSSDWSFEMTGGGVPTLSSDVDDARKDMDNIPWMLELGPQLVRKITSGLEAKLAVMQAISSDLRTVKLAGQVLVGKLTYKFSTSTRVLGLFEEMPLDGTLEIELTGGSEEFLSTYFEVPVVKALPTRPAYTARTGFLSDELSYFQSIKRGKVAYYVGGTLSDYSHSINRASPLHRSDFNVTAIAGITLILGESKRPSVPADETKGLIPQNPRLWRLLERPQAE